MLKRLINLLMWPIMVHLEYKYGDPPETEQERYMRLNRYDCCYDQMKGD